MPLALYGYPLPPPPPPLDLAHGLTSALHPPRLTLAAALQVLRQQQREALHAAPGAAAQPDRTPLQPLVRAALAELLRYWQLVGTSERLIALNPPPAAAFKAAASVADAVCSQLVDGSFGKAPPLPPQQQRRRPSEMADVPADAVAMESQQQPQETQQEEAQQQLSLEALLAMSTDMVLGWCGMLAGGGGGSGGGSASARSVGGSVVQCSMAGLAAAVLLCSSCAGARLVVARWGVVVLGDVLSLAPSGVRGSERCPPVACPRLSCFDCLGRMSFSSFSSPPLSHLPAGPFLLPASCHDSLPPHCTPGWGAGRRFLAGHLEAAARDRVARPCPASSGSPSSTSTCSSSGSSSSNSSNSNSGSSTCRQGIDPPNSCSRSID